MEIKACLLSASVRLMLATWRCYELEAVLQVGGPSHLMCRNTMWELDFHNNLLTYVDLTCTLCTQKSQLLVNDSYFLNCLDGPNLDQTFCSLKIKLKLFGYI